MENELPSKLGRRIERFLRSARLRYIIDQDGDYHVALRLDEDNLRMHIIFMCEGLRGEILSILIRFEGKIPQLSPEEALQKANEWNLTRRWPRIYWKEGYFYGDFHLDTELNISYKALAQNILHVIVASAQFLMYITGRETGLIEEIKRHMVAILRLN